MSRLFGFDYKTPFFYMVTLKRLPGFADFSAISDDGRLERNAITVAFEETVAHFHEKWRCIEPISPFVVMPDHVHAIVKIRDVEPRKTLPVLVWQLERALSAAYWEVGGTAPTRKTPEAGGRSRLPQDPVLREAAAPGGVLRGAATPAPVFEKDWHDWIVKRQGQLPAFRRYVRENPERAALRRRNTQYFGQVRSVAFLGREWFACGNAALLDLPVLVPLKGHRTAKPGTSEWDSLVDSAARIGPGGAGVSTFMSPLEKACGNAVFRAGGGLVVLCPDGFHPRWHPPREKERICASGRMLFLSLYEADGRKPSNKTLYDRCHEMIDLVVDGLTPSA